MKLKSFGKTDTGNVREHNEDAFLIDDEAGFIALADGMGGHNAGEHASWMFTQITRREFDHISPILDCYRGGEESKRREIINVLPKTVETANHEIWAEAQRDLSKNGMGTTGIIFVPCGPRAFICHVGDSRVYLFREGDLHQLTEDHSLVMSMVKDGTISLEEAATHKLKNVILRGIGLQPTVKVDTLFVDLLPGDAFLICSDGLSDLISHDRLRELIVKYRGNELVERAITAAKSNGGHDNITIVVVEVEQQTKIKHPIPALPDYGILETGQVLVNIFLFSQLSTQELIKVHRTIYKRSYEAGARIIEEGANGQELFLLMEGTVQIWRGNTYLTSVSPGGHFGELGIIGDAPRSASVVAETPCTTLVLGRDDLLRLIREDMSLGNRILWAFLSNMADRVRDLSDKLSQLP